MSVPLPALFTIVPSLLRGFSVCCGPPPRPHHVLASSSCPSSSLQGTVVSCCRDQVSIGLTSGAAEVTHEDNHFPLSNGWIWSWKAGTSSLKINKLGPFMLQKMKSAAFVGDSAPGSVGRVSLLPSAQGSPGPLPPAKEETGAEGAVREVCRKWRDGEATMRVKERLNACKGSAPGKGRSMRCFCDLRINSSYLRLSSPSFLFSACSTFSFKQPFEGAS